MLNLSKSKIADHGMKRILVIGASGMLGHAIFRLFSGSSQFEAYGSVRTSVSRSLLPIELQHRIVENVDVENPHAIAGLFAQVRPDVVVNCVGVIKQSKMAVDPLAMLSLNAMLPHRIAQMCRVAGARLVHISTDCVFSGAKGNYAETDMPDALDYYGRSKYLGEVDYPHAITLRTSIIGRELFGGQSLIEWFLAQQSAVKGYTRAIFSGIPTVELARIIRDHVLPHPELHGIYHVSADPISKHDLLLLVARRYDKNIEISPDDQTVIDRSLDSSRFRRAVGYKSQPWPELVSRMYEFG
jgi:dTDP-4-dehydrorhamnose reductase